VSDYYVGSVARDGVWLAVAYTEAGYDHTAVVGGGIDCEFGRCPAFTYLRPGDDRGDVRAEVEAARRERLRSRRLYGRVSIAGLVRAVRAQDEHDRAGDHVVPELGVRLDGAGPVGRPEDERRRDQPESE